MLIFATAFRLFFLLAALLALLAIPAWTLVVTQNRVLASSLGAMGWHAHEMTFGYTGAVLAGFLLTATQQWTKRTTLRGAPLALLIALWLAGRVAVLQAGSTASAISLIVDSSFFLAVAIAIGIPIARSGSRRNYAFPFLILLIGCCDLAQHLHMRGVAPVLTARATSIAMDVIVIVIIIFGGRIVPMFTKGATGARVRDRNLLDHLGLGLILAYAVLHAVYPEHVASHACAIAAGSLTCLRLQGWGGMHTWKRPIVWVLHLSWLFIGLALALQGLEGLTNFVPSNSFFHLLTIGGIGLMTHGMVARVSLGHTGRKLQVPRLVALGFILLVIAMLARVAAPMVSPLHYWQMLWVASGAWSLAFLALLVHFTPILLSPRADGKEG